MIKRIFKSTKFSRCGFWIGGGKIKVRIFLAVLIVFSIALLSLGSTYATAENETYLNLTQEIIENSTNSINDTTNLTSSTNTTTANSSTTSKPIQIPTSFKPYLKSSQNCHASNSQIKSLAASITKGKTTTYQKAVAIFNWVRDKLGYSFYYNTRYGAVGTLAKMTGNCCDTAHLLIALSRAAGIPARYVHGYCKFSSGNSYGHVWAQIYIDGKWYNADATSSRNTFGVIKNWNTATAKIHGTYASLSF